MFRIIQLIVLFATISQANEQIILVISDDFNATTAKLYSFEKNASEYEPVFPPIDVNLGRSGLGWGEGLIPIAHSQNEPLKREGDGRAPSGVFSLYNAFGYANTRSTKLNYIPVSRDLICVDDVTDSHYNQVLHVKNRSALKSFEKMLRDDDLYELGVMVQHNKENTPSYGSCIFLHVQKGINKPTAGCTTMSKEELTQLISWLDQKKNPLLIQVPKAYYHDILTYFPKLPELSILK
ncbi:MAG: hypothetical protein U9N52_11835 [Campylobacterota bacterium]|nr:hypothetical protein [Campylobacterota bacterium]